MSRDRRMCEGLSIAATKARAVKVQHPGLSLAGGRSPRPLPYVHVGVNRGDRHNFYYGAPRRNQTPHGGRETSDPLACFTSLVDEDQPLTAISISTEPHRTQLPHQVPNEHAREHRHP
jgi:hypothetical protein